MGMGRPSKVIVKRAASGSVASKDCSRCGEHKPATAFGPDKRNSTGLGSWCKPCITAKLREKRQSLQGEERVEFNRKRLAVKKRWAAKNPEAVKAISRRSSTTYQKRHPDRHKARVHAGYHYRWLLDLFDKCAACGATSGLTLDHVIPLGEGKNHPSNLQVLCQPCNTRKGPTTADYRTAGDLLKILAAV